jgi:hypothetical protein
MAHLRLLARVLTGPLEATAAREADADAQRMRTLSRASASAMVSVLTRLQAHALRRQPLVVEDLLAPLHAPGVSVDVVPAHPLSKATPPRCASRSPPSSSAARPRPSNAMRCRRCG